MSNAAAGGRAYWRRSSYSTANGNCVEVRWRKSSYSHNNGACVEVAPSSAIVAVRDSKRPEGTVLAIPSEAFVALVHNVK